MSVLYDLTQGLTDKLTPVSPFFMGLKTYAFLATQENRNSNSGDEKKSLSLLCLYIYVC